MSDTFDKAKKLLQSNAYIDEKARLVAELGDLVAQQKKHLQDAEELDKPIAKAYKEAVAGGWTEKDLSDHFGYTDPTPRRGRRGARGKNATRTRQTAATTTPSEATTAPPQPSPTSPSGV